VKLLELWLADRSHLDTKSVHQVIAFSGSGKLAEANDTSREFCEYLSHVPSSFLERYADECLTLKFDNSGLVLQDVVNEIGRRLGFSVVNGRYRGVPGQPGFDGLWSAESGKKLVVEVKTSDAYRINLDGIAEYRKRLAVDHAVELERSSILLVVGREDTGGLEAQIRGSRHAWEMRLISIDALVRLMKVKEDLGDPATIQKISDLLVPREFTRLDPIVDLVFDTAADAKEEDDLEEVEAAAVPMPIDHASARKSKKFTPVSFHDECVARIEAYLRTPLIKKAKTLFATGDDRVRLVCAVSRRHGEGERETYWFAFHPDQRAYVEQAKNGYVAFGCGSATLVFLIRAPEFLPLLESLNMTRTPDREYWHVHIDHAGSEFLLTRKGGIEPVTVSRYLI